MIILDEIKAIIIFFSQNLGIFLKKLLVDLIFLTGTLLLIISFALVNKLITGEMQVTLVFSLIILLTSHFFKKKITSRNQLELNQAFTKHKTNAKDSGFNPLEFEKLFRERKKEIKEKYKKLSRRILLAIVLSCNYIETIGQLELKMLKGKSIKNTLIEFLVTVLFFLPFLLVLIFSTLETDITFRLFLLVIGLAFISFLHSAIIKPVFTLLLQKQTDNILLSQKQKYG